jgi:hypothetical protein
MKLPLGRHAGTRNLSPITSGKFWLNEKIAVRLIYHSSGGREIAAVGPECVG